DRHSEPGPFEEPRGAAAPTRLSDEAPIRDGAIHAKRACGFFHAVHPAQRAELLRRNKAAREPTAREKRAHGVDVFPSRIRKGTQQRRVHGAEQRDGGGDTEPESSGGGDDEGGVSDDTASS